MKLNLHNQGFTLLFASLIVSLLLAISLAILNITYQQFLLSSVAKESQFAFYNADTGVECALYYDKNNPTGKFFATSTESLPGYLDADNNDLTCNGALAENMAVTKIDNGSASTVFDIAFNDSQCELSGRDVDKLMHVQVDKFSDAQGNINTVISSYGYNSCHTSNPRRVERGFRTTY